MRDHRLLFEKSGLGIYISHLDLMRTMQRAFLRADLRIKHTEGFNPHPHMVFALPLPVGCASECELVDLCLETECSHEELPERLAPCLPAGIRPLAAYPPERKFKDIRWMAITGRLCYDGGNPSGAADAVRDVLTAKELTVMRKTKRGESEFDLAPFLRDVCVENGEDALLLTATISAQEPSINPELLTAALRRYCSAAPEFAAYTRRELYDEQGNTFR